MRKIAIVSLLVFVTVLSMGNISSEVNVNMSGEGVEDYDVKVKIPNEVLNENETEEFEIFVFETAEEEFNERIEDLNYDNKNITSYKKSNSTVYIMKIDGISVNKTSLEEDYNISTPIRHSKDENGTIRYEQSLGGILKEDDFRVLENLYSYYGHRVELTYKVNTTHNVTSTNGNKIDNNTVVWNLSTPEFKNNLYLETDGPERKDGIFVSVLVVLLVLLIFSVLIAYYTKYYNQENDII